MEDVDDAEITMVTFPKCTHSVCVECFKRCFYGEVEENEPKFPYSTEKEDEYWM